MTAILEKNKNYKKDIKTNIKSEKMSERTLERTIDKKTEKKYTKKEKIVWEALRVFRKQGYHRTSISDLSEACGIHNAHFYYYFKDKEDLLGECLKLANKIFSKKVFKVAYLEEKTVQEKILMVVEFCKMMFLEDKTGCVMANTVLETAQYEPKFLPIIQAFFDEWFNALTFLYSEIYEPKIARNKAEQAIQDIEGGIMLMRLYSNEKYFFNALQRAVEVLL
jgi:TetR/AcrR family transcriptional regulator, transcriptional repressor for nem operon